MLTPKEYAIKRRRDLTRERVKRYRKRREREMIEESCRGKRILVDTKT